MKKALLLTLILTGFQTTYYAQRLGTTSTACVDDCLNELGECLTSNGVSFNVIDTGSEIYLYGIGAVPPGQINSCIVHYNHDRGSCPAAPVITDKTNYGSATNKRK